VSCLLRAARGALRGGGGVRRQARCGRRSAGGRGWECPSGCSCVLGAGPRRAAWLLGEGGGQGAAAGAVARRRGPRALWRRQCRVQDAAGSTEARGAAGCSCDTGPRCSADGGRDHTAAVRVCTPSVLDGTACCWLGDLDAGAYINI
jgi:hypothetical protein